jgi:hypothetical protein
VTTCEDPYPGLLIGVSADGADLDPRAAEHEHACVKEACAAPTGPGGEVVTIAKSSTQKGRAQRRDVLADRGRRGDRVRADDGMMRPASASSLVAEQGASEAVADAVAIALLQ